MQKPVVEPPQVFRRLEPGGSGPVSSARLRRMWWATPTRCCVRAGGGHGEGLRRSCDEAAGEELGVDPVEWLVVNVGTVAGLPSVPVGQAGNGKACRLLMDLGQGGGSVVVRGRESRSHGEGIQWVRSPRIVMPGGRW